MGLFTGKQKKYRVGAKVRPLNADFNGTRPRGKVISREDGGARVLFEAPYRNVIALYRDELLVKA